MNLLSDWSERIKYYFTGFGDKTSQLINNPTLFIGLIGLTIVIIALFKFNKVKLDVKMLARIGIALAIACVLQVLRIYHFPMGGSVTLGGMVPIIIIAYIYGPEVGMFTGFMYGLLNLFLDPYFVHPVQILFDYPLPSIAIGIAGYFKNNIKIGTIVAFLIKFICHFISGVVFFGQYASDYGMNKWIYSLVVNGPMVATDAVICVVIISIIPIKIIAKGKEKSVYSN